MIMKDSPVHRWDMRNGHDSVTRLQVRGPGRFAKGTGYSITKGRDYLDVGRDMGWKRGRKTKEREAPQSGIQMLLLFCVHCEARAHPIPHLPEGNSTPVTGVKLLFKICTPRPPAPLRLPVRGQANPETVATMPF